MDAIHDIEALTQRQMENEERVIDGGIKNYRKAIAEAEAKGEFADTLPGRWLIANFIEPIRERIEKFVEESTSGKPGPQAIGATILNRLDYDGCAYIAIRAIVNRIVRSSGSCEQSSVRGIIAHGLKEEMHHNHMADEKTHTYKYWMRQIELAPDRMTRKRCMDRLKKNFATLPEFKTEAERDALTAAAEFLIQAAVNGTGIAHVVTHAKQWKNGVKTPNFLELTPRYQAKLASLHDRAESLWPNFEPMLCPPRPWTGAFNGGFVGKLGERSILVRTSNRSYLEDIHNNIGKMDKVLSALNAVQATPWRINRKIYDAMSAAFAGNGQQYGLPSSEELPEPVRPADIKTNKAAAKDFVNALKAVQRLEKVRASKFKAVADMLVTAKLYRDEPAIWFAHNLDWRGRIYPMSSHLSPQGEEQHRALLEFAEGIPLETDEAVEWLAIHGAGCYGYDKVPFADRVAWVRENEHHIRKSAEAPLDYLWWAQKDVDKPWMFLAWCIEWVGYLDNGKSYVSHLPVAMDGSCNGLQNFAAMLKHEETARAVNLAPSAVPSDIYQQVADKVIPVVRLIAISDPRPDNAILAEAEARTALEYADSDRVSKETAAIDKLVKSGGISKKEARERKKDVKLTINVDERKLTAAMWDVLSARWIQDHITRKLVKRPVMTYPYSVTLYGMRDQLVDTLLEMRGDGTAFPPAHVGKVASMLKTVVFNAIQETVVAAAEAMQWLRTAAKVVAENNLPVTWTSPVGMLVMQNYWKSFSKTVSVHVGGVRYRPTVSHKKVGEVDINKQASGVAPNFVHSCDASHLMLTVLACQESGVKNFHMIHDSFGTHARHASTLAATLREQFITIYGDGTVLTNFHEQLLSQVENRPELANAIPPPPALGDFDLNLVRESKYFFA